MSGECFNEFQLTIKSLSPNLYFEFTNCKGRSNQSWWKGNKTSTTTTQTFICECGKSNESPSNYTFLGKTCKSSTDWVWKDFETDFYQETIKCHRDRKHKMVSRWNLATIYKSMYSAVNRTPSVDALPSKSIGQAPRLRREQKMEKSLFLVSETLRCNFFWSYKRTQSHIPFKSWNFAKLAISIVSHLILVWKN